MKDYLFYYDLTGRRRLRPYVRVSLILMALMGLLTVVAVVLKVRQERWAASSPLPTPPALAVVPTPPPAVPTFTPTPPRPPCLPPLGWKLKPLLAPGEDAPQGQPPVYGLEPQCAYDALYRALLYNFLTFRGYTVKEINGFLGAPSQLNEIMDPYEAQAGKYPPYAEWPREIEVLGADGQPRSLPVRYTNWVDGRQWGKRAFYAAPSYCYKPPKGTRIPLRGQPALVICAVEWLLQLGPGRDLFQIAEWTAFSYQEYTGKHRVVLVYYFIDRDGNAFESVYRSLDDVTVEQATVELSHLGNLHGTGVWFFGDSHLDLPPPDAFGAPVVDWRKRALFFNAPTEEYPRPEGWEDAPTGDQVPELIDYIVEMRSRVTGEEPP